MKELEDIVAAFEKVASSGKKAALATVVKVKGSTYRKPGARMLMISDNPIVGSISGGCLESDVFEQAQQVIDSGEPLLVNYDTTSDEDISWGLGLGCKGMVHVLIEPLETLQPTLVHVGEQELNPIVFIKECFRRRRVGMLATVFGIEGQVQAKLANHLMLHSDNTVITDIQDKELVTGILNDAAAVLNNSKSKVKVYSLSTGSAEVLLEAIAPPVPLLIFGAGSDVVPVVSLAKALGWHVTVVDTRSNNATSDGFPLANNFINCRAEKVGDRLPFDSHTVAVVMTHNYLHDLELLKTFLPSHLQYLGLLGPKRRTEQLLQELSAQGITTTDAQLQQLYAPIGLDIGGDTPEAIALAIISEIQAVLNDRSGGFLRDRHAPIHQRPDE
jgi:xanthine dehydrogenase accessory factor